MHGQLPPDLALRRASFPQALVLVPPHGVQAPDGVLTYVHSCLGSVHRSTTSNLKCIALMVAKAIRNSPGAGPVGAAIDGEQQR